MFEKLMEKSQKYFALAKSEQDLDKKLFYLSVSKGYKIKAYNLTIEEA